jgi:hypothetical protein
LKKLRRNPPLVKMPRVSELLNTHPLVGALLAPDRDPFLSNAKETIKGNGTILYREGTRPTGIWLISTGIVKVSFVPRHHFVIFWLKYTISHSIWFNNEHVHPLAFVF